MLACGLAMALTQVLPFLASAGQLHVIGAGMPRTGGFAEDGLIYFNGLLKAAPGATTWNTARMQDQARATAVELHHCLDGDVHSFT